MDRNFYSNVLLVVLLSLSTSVFAYTDDEFQHCMADEMLSASDEASIGSLRAACRERLQDNPVEDRVLAEEYIPSAIERRQKIEADTEGKPFVLTPHRPNYILLASHNMSDPNESPFKEQFPEEEFSVQSTEVKFQISFKFAVIEHLFNDMAGVYVAYTNRSFWQLYNKDDSSPFRETNHEPEAWLRVKTNWRLLGMRGAFVDLGFSHQSNGRSGSLSRSWNRLFAQAVFQKDNFYFSIRPWWRIPENSSDDDNPDIEDYLGNFEVGGLYKLGDHSISLMLRNNFDFSDNRGAVQLDWSFPLGKRMRGYVQWFNGYGESLIDYDSSVNSIGFGVQLTDWL